MWLVGEYVSVIKCSVDEVWFELIKLFEDLVRGV